MYTTIVSDPNAGRPGRQRETETTVAGSKWVCSGEVGWRCEEKTTKRFALIVNDLVFKFSRKIKPLLLGGLSAYAETYNL